MKQQTKQYNRHDGFHTLTKLPPTVTKLFTQGPPLKPSKLKLKKAEERKYILTGVAELLPEVSNYEKLDCKISENKYLDVYEDAINESQREQEALRAKLQDWHPESDPNISSDPYRTLFVGRLDYSVDEVALQKSFVKYGEIESCRVVRDKEGKSRGYGFVQFVNYEDSKQCFRDLGVRRGIEIMGRTSIVDIERGRTVKYFKPRRLGGGLGGRGYQKKQLMNKLSTPASSGAPLGMTRRVPRRHDTYEGRGSLPPQSRYPASGAPLTTPPVPPYQKPASSSYRSRRDRSRHQPSNSSDDALMH